MIIVDTNVASELMRSSPSEPVARWIRSRAPRDVGTTAITVAEIRYGIARLPNGRRKHGLSKAAEQVFAAFAEQVLPFDAPAAEHYATIAQARNRVGSPIAGFDAQIAAICRTHQATLATRNLKDFQGTGVEVIDPWSVG